MDIIMKTLVIMILSSTILYTAPCLSQKSVKFKFASYYGDHMVLQKAPQRATIWGYASKLYNTVWISVNDILQVKTRTRPGPFKDIAVWSLQLPAMDSGGSHTIKAESSEGEVTLSDVLFGDVWICSGQSNMQFTLGMGFNASLEIADTVNHPNIRVFTASLSTSLTPEYDFLSISEQWSVPSFESVGNVPWTYFSAVCWLYGKYLSEVLKYPIGLIATSFEGTPIEAWSSPDALKQCPSDQKRSSNMGHGYYHNDKSTFSPESTYVPQPDEKYIADPETKSAIFPDFMYVPDPHRKLTLPQSNLTSDTFLPYPNTPSVLWNSMIHPLINMTIYGVIWYQGEANALPGLGTSLYTCRFPAMIDDWREKFEEGSNSKGKHHTNFHLALFSIHPRDKQDVAERLCTEGLAVGYKRDDLIKLRGPFPSDFQVSNDKVITTYDNHKTTIETRTKVGFEVCCVSQSNHSNPGTYCDHAFDVWHPVPIKATDSTTVTVDYGAVCPSTLKLDIGAIRYAWRESPCLFKKCAVYNKLSGYPAPPFVKYFYDD